MRVAILTVSDSAATGRQADLSGPALRELVSDAGGAVARADVVPDEIEAVAGWLRQVADEDEVDVAITSGGTGLAPRDITPEATRSVLDKEATGIAEAIRAAGLAKTPRAMLSRGTAGVRGRTLIVNFSGSPKAVVEQWEVLERVLDHAVDTIRGAGAHPEADAARRL